VEQQTRPAVPPAPFLPIRRIGIGAPLAWLAGAAGDLRRAPGASLFYGVAFALMGWILAWLLDNAVEYVSALAAGFLLVGPFLATGLYDIARRLERGETVRLASTLTAWRANASSIGVFTLILVILLLVWARASLITFALFFSTGMPTLKGFVGQVMSLEHADFVVTWFGVGAVFALLAFASSVVTIPSMMERDTDTIPAVLDSFRAVLANPGPMAVWALAIAVLVGAGIATGFVGLAVTGPWVGLATWRAYRDVLGSP
jgi:uncharacterized membrane protein